MERKRLYIIGGIVFGIMAIIALIQLLLPNNGSLTIVAPTTAAINITVTNDNGDFNRTALIGAGSRQRFTVQEGSYKIASSAGSLRTIDVLQVAGNQEKTLEVSFATTKKATQISAALDNCPLVIGDSVYDYPCMEDGFVYKLDGFGTKEILFDSQYFEYMQPYKNGFLGVPQDGSFSYIDVTTQTIQPLNLPQDISSTNDLSQIIITTSGDPAKTYFAVSLTEANSLYLYKDTTDISPKKLALSKNDAYMNAVSFKDDTLIVFSGPIDATDEHDGEGSTGIISEPEPLGGGGSITEYDLTGRLLKNIATPEGFSADRIFKLNNNYYAADRIEGAEIFYWDESKLESIHTIEEIVDMVNVRGNLYVQTDNAINVFLPGNAGSFSMKSVSTPTDSQNLNGIFTGPGYLIFSTTPPGVEISNVYRLEN